MPLFGRHRRSGCLPPDIVEQLERFGRSQYYPQERSSPVMLEADMYRLAERDRDGFLADMAAVVVPAGGWAALGGMRLVMSVISGELDQPDYNATVMAGLQFLRSNGVPNNRLSANEWQFWLRTQGQHEPWLVGRPEPADTLTPLQPAEMRRVAQVDADPHSNLIYVRQAAPDNYVAVIDGAWSDEEPRRVQTDWYAALSLHELYKLIGPAYQIPCYWADPELEPYFPLPPAAI